MQQTQSPKAGERHALAMSITGAGREAILERTQHTPGPWKMRDESRTAPNGDVSMDFDIDSVGQLALGDYRKQDQSLIEVAHANARLIAAAPELLEACVRLLPIIGKLSVVGGYIKCRIKPHDADSFHSTYSRLRAAIAKAEGTNLALAQHEAEEQETEHQLAGNGNITED